MEVHKLLAADIKKETVARYPTDAQPNDSRNSPEHLMRRFVQARAAASVIEVILDSSQPSTIVAHLPD